MANNQRNDFDPDQLERQLKGWGKFVGEQVESGVGQLGKVLEDTTRQVGKAWNQTKQKKKKKPVQRPTFRGKRLRMKTGRVVNRIFGFMWLILAVAFFAAMLSELFSNGQVGTTIIAVVFTALSSWACVVGLSKASLYQRGEKYLDCLKDKTSCSVRQLSVFASTTKVQTQKDLRVLAQRRIIENLIVSQDGQQIFSTMEEYEQYRQELENQKGKAAQPIKTEAPPVIEQPTQNKENAFIKELVQLNTLIEDEEVSGRVEEICKTSEMIFEKTSQMEVVPSGMKKFESYYLPTTVKLLRVYTQVDDQPVEGIHIETIRRDIPSILDTLLKAYHNLLDSLYADTALDVSSEIAVLKDMLSQEGLVEEDFSIKNQ